MIEKKADEKTPEDSRLESEVKTPQKLPTPSDFYSILISLGADENYAKHFSYTRYKINVYDKVQEHLQKISENSSDQTG